MIKPKPEKTKSLSSQIKLLKDQLDIVKATNQDLTEDNESLVAANDYLKAQNEKIMDEMSSVCAELRSEKNALVSQVSKTAMDANNFKHVFYMIETLLNFAKARSTDTSEPRELEVLRYLYENTGRP